MSNVAVNDAGEVMVLQGSEWRPAPIAQNDAGARMYYDGTAWQPVPGGQPPAPEGSGVGAWLGRRARDVIEGVASFPSAAVDAMFPGVTYARDAAGRMNLQQGAVAVADALGLPRPATDDERMTSAVVQGVMGAVPTMGVGAPGLVGVASQVVGGGLGGGAAEAARQAGYGEAAQIAAGMLGGVGGAAATQAAGALGRGVAGAAAPFTQRGREGVVADTLLRSASDPQNLGQRIQQGVDAPDARLPGSPVTTGLAARDPGLLGVESSVRAGALGTDVAVPLRDAALARAAAQENAIAGMSDGRTPGERGAAVRGERARPGQTGEGLRGAQQARQRVVSRAYEAIDPAGTSRLPLAPLQAVLSEEAAGRWGAGAGDMPPALRNLFDDLAGAGDAQPWRFMQNVRSRAGAIAGDPAADARVQATARRVVQAVDDTAEAAALPIQPAGRARTMEDMLRGDAEEGLSARPDVRAAIQDQRSGTRDARQGGVSLVQFVRQRGGIREGAGDVTDGGRMPGLFSGSGRSLHQAMEAAIDAGYYPGRTLQHDALNPAATLMPAEFLRDIGEELNRRRRIYPAQMQAMREEAADRAGLRQNVERDLDQAGVGFTDSPQTIGAAVRPIDDNAPRAGMDRADGTIVIPPDQRFTPEQAQRWRTAAELRRRLGEDFDRDTTGANAAGRILADGGFGAPRMVDEQVPGAALANLSSVRQVLRASGGDAQVRQGLQGQFMDMLARQALGNAEMVDTAGIAQRSTSPAGFRRFWDQNRVVARELFGPQEYRRLELLARDFAEASIGANTGGTRNSQTAQNLSVAGMIARASGGMIDANNPAAHTIVGGPVLRWLYQAPEQATRELLGRAMADPRLAAILLAKASPASVRRATAYIEQNMLGRLAGAAGTAAQRQIVRTAGEEQRRQAQPSQ